MAVYGDGRMDGRVTDGWIVCMSVSLIGKKIEWKDRELNYYTHAHRHSCTHAKIKHSWMHTKRWTEERIDAHIST